MYNQVPQENNKKGSKKVIFAYILSFVVIGLLLTSLIKNNREVVNEKKKEEETKSIEEKVNKQKQENVNILTDTMKDEINEKVGIILGDKDFIKNGKSGYGFRYDLLKKDLTDSDKQYIALKNTEFVDLTIDWQSIEEIKTFVEHDQSSLSEFKQQTKTEVNKTAKQLFGKELTNIEEVVGKCPKYQYYQDKEIFIYFPPRCGGASSSEFLGYIYDYKRKGDNVTVLMSIGYKLENDIYEDFDITSESTITARNKIEDLEEPIINKDNYKKFSRYNVNFIKLEDGGFYLDSIKQIN